MEGKTSMNISRVETETTVTGVQADGYWIIGSNWPRHIRRLEREIELGRAKVLRNSIDYLEVLVPTEHFDPLTGFKRQISDATKQAMSERMKAIHKDS